MFFPSPDPSVEQKAAAAVIRFASQDDNTHTQELMTSVINTFFFLQKVYEEFIKTAVLVEQIRLLVNDLVLYEIIKGSDQDAFYQQLQWIAESRNDKLDIVDGRHILISDIFLCLTSALKDQDKYIDGSTYADRLRKFILIIKNIHHENACTVGIRNELMCILHNSYRGVFIITEITSTVTSLIREYDEHKLNHLLCSESLEIQAYAFKILLSIYGVGNDEHVRKFYDNDDELRESIYQRLSNSLGHSLRTQKELLEKKIPGLYKEIDKALVARENIQLMPSRFKKTISELKKYYDQQKKLPQEIQHSFSQCNTLDAFSKSICYGYLILESLYQKAKLYVNIIAIGEEEAAIKDKSREILLYLEAIGYPKSFNLMNISLEDFSAKINVLEDDFSQLLAKQDYQNIIIDSFALLRASEANLRDFKKIYYRVVRVFNEYHLDFTDDGLTNLVNVSVEIENDHTYINITPYTLNCILWQALLTSPDTWSDVFKQAIQFVLQLLQQENTDSTEHFLLIKESSYKKELISEIAWLLAISNNPEANQTFSECYLPCHFSLAYLETDDNLLKIYNRFPFLTESQKEKMLEKCDNRDKISVLHLFLRHTTEIAELEFIINQLPEVTENERDAQYHHTVIKLLRSMLDIANTADAFNKVIKQIKMPYRLTLLSRLNYFRVNIEQALDVYHSIIDFNDKNHEQVLNDPDVVYLLKFFLDEKEFDDVNKVFIHEERALKALIQTVDNLIKLSIQTKTQIHLRGYIRFFISVAQTRAKSDRTYTIEKLTIKHDWQKRFLEKFNAVLKLDFTVEKNKKYYEQLVNFYGEISDLPERSNIDKVKLIETYVDNEYHFQDLSHAIIILDKLSDVDQYKPGEPIEAVNILYSIKFSEQNSTSDQAKENDIYAESKKVLREWINGDHLDLIESLIEYSCICEAPIDKLKTVSIEHFIEIAYLSRVHKKTHQDNYDHDVRIYSYITDPRIRRPLLEYLELYQLSSTTTIEDKRKKLISVLTTIEIDSGLNKVDDECSSAIESLIIKHIDFTSMEDIKNFMLQFDDRLKYALTPILRKLYYQYNANSNNFLFEKYIFANIFSIHYASENLSSINEWQLKILCLFISDKDEEVNQPIKRIIKPQSINSNTFEVDFTALDVSQNKDLIVTNIINVISRERNNLENLFIYMNILLDLANQGAEACTVWYDIFSENRQWQRYLLSKLDVLSKNHDIQFLKECFRIFIKFDDKVFIEGIDALCNNEKVLKKANTLLVYLQLKNDDVAQKDNISIISEDLSIIEFFLELDVDETFLKYAGFARLVKIYELIDKSIEHNLQYKTLLKASISRACLCETNEQASNLINIYERIYKVAMQFQHSKIINKILLYGIRPSEEDTFIFVTKGLDAIINVNNTLERSEILALTTFDYCNRQVRDPLGMNWIAEDKMYAVLTFESNDDESKDEAHQIAGLSRTLLITYNFCEHNFNEAFETIANTLWNKERRRPDWYDKIKYLSIGLLQAFVMELMNPDELLDYSNWYQELSKLIKWTDNHPQKNFLEIIKSPYFYFFADIILPRKELIYEVRYTVYETLMDIMVCISQKQYNHSLQSLHFIDFAKFLKETLRNSNNFLAELSVIHDTVKHYTSDSREQLKEEIILRLQPNLALRRTL